MAAGNHAPKTRGTFGSRLSTNRPFKKSSSSKFRPILARCINCPYHSLHLARRWNTDFDMSFTQEVHAARSFVSQDHDDAEMETANVVTIRPVLSRPTSYNTVGSQDSEKTAVVPNRPEPAYLLDEKNASFLQETPLQTSTNVSSTTSLNSFAHSDAALLTGDRHTFGDPTAFTSRIQKQLRRAHRKAQYLGRPKWLSYILQYVSYLFILAIIYFCMVGYPFWDGVVLSFWGIYGKKNFVWLSAIFIGVAFSYAAMPLLVLFQKSREFTEEERERNSERAKETSLIIACYKSAGCIQHTLDCALKTFPAENIFVIANGNSDTPLDNTGDICLRNGVNHIWVPIGSKIAAQYVGVAAAHRFKFCLMIDDDVALPENFPIVTNRIQCNKEGETGGRGRVKCIGYALQATDGEGDAGNYCQQAQDLEYKLAGLSKQFFGKYGSASFPHGAISLWERTFFEECFKTHPGYRISEDWFFGVVCRNAGGRIDFCSEVFVKTEVPKKLLRSGKGDRAGYGELTVTAQRLWRWNFFLMARILYNAHFILFEWQLRQYSFMTKLEMFQELYGSLLMLALPIVMPIALARAPQSYFPITAGVIAMYMALVVVFVELHLRLRGIKVNRKAAYLYYPVYKVWLEMVNVLSW